MTTLTRTLIFIMFFSTFSFSTFSHSAWKQNDDIKNLQDKEDKDSDDAMKTGLIVGVVFVGGYYLYKWNKNKKEDAQDAKDAAALKETSRLKNLVVTSGDQESLAVEYYF